jgi:flagellar motor component MotA
MPPQAIKVSSGERVPASALFVSVVIAFLSLAVHDSITSFFLVWVVSFVVLSVSVIASSVSNLRRAVSATVETSLAAEAARREEKPIEVEALELLGELMRRRREQDR